MIRNFSLSIAALALMLGTAGYAQAHGIVYNSYESPRHYHGDVLRDRAMPAWLWRKKGFRHWYYRAAHRLNYRLAWWQIYDIYRWERRYDHPRYYKSYYGARHHQYDWYKRYWRERDREYEHRDRRHKKRRGHRYDD